MAEPLARLRSDLDIMPSPAPDRPGLLIRDPHLFSDATLIVPPPLIECLRLFDGNSTALDLRATLVRLLGELDVSEVENHLIETLRDAAFLEDAVYERKKAERYRSFAEAPVRLPTHAGSAYLDEPGQLKEVLDRYLTEAPGAANVADTIGIAAPHVSPEGGWRSYGAAYRTLSPALKEKTFAILGTSHYGEADRFGLTRKPFRTPYGEARTDAALASRLAREAPGAVAMEDYCHSTEHSIEFQVVFLQHVFGPDISILPILCGSYARSIYTGGMPEHNEDVKRFLDALGAISAELGDRLFWVLGVDMAHMGRRYGDPFEATAGEGLMSEVEQRDSRRIETIEQGDAEGFWGLVQERRDDLKWCGSAPFYTFMRANPRARALRLGYEQWNIDEQSVVTFGALAFQQNG